MFTVANLVLNESTPKQDDTISVESSHHDQSMNDDRSESIDDDSRSTISRPGEELDDAMIKSIMESGKRIDFEPYVRRRNGTKCLKSRKKMSEPDMQELRLRINSRERKRMHDLNSALDSLRQVMPFNQGPSVRKLSKISTLLMARSYILALHQSVEEMRRLLNTQQAKEPKLTSTSPSPPSSKTGEIVPNVTQNTSVCKSIAPLQNGPALAPVHFSSAPSMAPFFAFPPLIPPTAFCTPYAMPIATRGQL